MIPFRELICKQNLTKYKGIPPSHELVRKVIAKGNPAGRKQYGNITFEKIYGITQKTIERYLLGHRGMPVHYWHIFYEFDNLEKFYATFKIRKKREAKEKAKQETPVMVSKHKATLDAYREQFNKRRDTSQ